MGVHPRVCVNPVSFPAGSPLAEDLEALVRLGISCVGAHRNKLLATGWDEGLALIERLGG